MDQQVWLEQLKLTPLAELEAMLPLRLDDYQCTGPEDKTLALLQAMFDFAPTAEGRRNVAIDILACQTDDRLRQLVSRYETGLIIPIRASGGRTPSVSDHPSRPSVDFDDIYNGWNVKPSKGDRQKMRNLVLQRDNYRCVLTRKCDLGSLNADKTDVQEDDVGAAELDTAHILPFSLIPSSDNRVTPEKSGMIWQVITAFSGIQLEELNGDDINRVENGIALEHSIHRLFGQLSLCFEPTDEVNTYRILHWIKPTVVPLLGLPDTVTFVPRSNIPAPDPRYLALHAACAKVVHQCGMAEILDKLINDLEQTPVLSTDGSSAHLLCRALEIVAVSS